MNYFTLLAVLVIGSFPAMAVETELQKILEIKLSTKLAKDIRPSGETKDFSYEVDNEKGTVKSVMIEFNSVIPSERFLQNDSKGFCLIQPRPGDVVLDRYFFFDLSNKRRYELTPRKEIKAILIQDIPGARANPECIFGTFNAKEIKK